MAEIISGIALLVAAAATILGYRRARTVDAVSAQSGIVTESRMGVGQVIESMNILLDQLQEDNREFREGAHDFKLALRECADRLAVVTAERDQAKLERDGALRELALFREKFGNPNIS